MCIGENEAASPWEPLHVERGFQRHQSTVTVVGVSGLYNVFGGSRAAAIVQEIADALAFVGSNDYRFAGQPGCALNPSHAAALHRAGYSKAQLQGELFERSKKPVRAFPNPQHLAPRQRDLGLLADETLVPFAERPEDVLLVVAGASGAGAHSLCLPTFGNTRAVTVAIPS